MKFDISIFFENLSRRFKSLPDRTSITGALHEDQCMFLWYLARFVLEWKENQTTLYRRSRHTFYFQEPFFFNRAIYEIMRKYTVESCRPPMATWRTRTACWIPRATNKHSEYVILTAFPRKQWLNKRASVLRYTYIAYLVLLSKWLPVYVHNIIELRFWQNNKLYV